MTGPGGKEEPLGVPLQHRSQQEEQGRLEASRQASSPLSKDKALSTLPTQRLFCETPPDGTMSMQKRFPEANVSFESDSVCAAGFRFRHHLTSLNR